jgi:hypothetical protein
MLLWGPGDSAARVAPSLDRFALVRLEQSLRDHTLRLSAHLRLRDSHRPRGVPAVSDSIRIIFEFDVHEFAERKAQNEKRDKQELSAFRSLSVNQCDANENAPDSIRMSHEFAFWIGATQLWQ